MTNSGQSASIPPELFTATSAAELTFPSSELARGGRIYINRRERLALGNADLNSVRQKLLVLG
jgi:hypothetical protein